MTVTGDDENYCSSTNRCTQCGTDCDADGDCIAGLVCNNDSATSQCKWANTEAAPANGGYNASYDYCVAPDA